MTNGYSEGLSRNLKGFIVNNLQSLIFDTGEYHAVIIQLINNHVPTTIMIDYDTEPHPSMAWIMASRNGAEFGK